MQFRRIKPAEQRMEAMKRTKKRSLLARSKQGLGKILPVILFLLGASACGGLEEFEQEVPWTCDTYAATCNGFYGNYIEKSVNVHARSDEDAYRRCEKELGRRFSGYMMCALECPWCEPADQGN
jgi:hypothetical protein